MWIVRYYEYRKLGYGPLERRALFLVSCFLGDGNCVLCGVGGGDSLCGGTVYIPRVFTPFGTTPAQQLGRWTEDPRSTERSRTLWSLCVTRTEFKYAL